MCYWQEKSIKWHAGRKLCQGINFSAPHLSLRQHPATWIIMQIKINISAIITTTPTTALARNAAAVRRESSFCGIRVNCTCWRRQCVVNISNYWLESGAPMPYSITRASAGAFSNYTLARCCWLKASEWKTCCIIAFLCECLSAGKYLAFDFNFPRLMWWRLFLVASWLNPSVAACCRHAAWHTEWVNLLKCGAAGFVSLL